ncbi:MAG TPA: hypothetical protein VF174_15920 [Micromonosporaceae bacterium]
MLTVHITGAMFDGRATQAVQDLREAIEYEVSWQAFAEARQIMDASFRRPTPYYEVQVTNERRGEEQVIHDRGIVYGPWLEGVSSRNQVSRFKGYHSFRRATQAVIPKVMGLVQHVMPPFLRRMNGH